MEEYAIEHRVIAKFKDIPLIVKGAFIIAEDRQFYNHAGISFQSLLRAIIENTARKSWDKKPAGGSTITQQIAKNLLVGNARKLSRKIREAIMAFRIESCIPKDKILEIYLNQLYLGKGCYGIVEACNSYFGKTLNKIEAHEAALLAALPSAPTIYINSKGFKKLTTKRNSILYQMYEMGYIGKEELYKNIQKPIEIKNRKQKLPAPYFSDEIFRMFSQYISRSVFFRNGYVITTTFNKEIQNHAEKALEDGMIEYTKRTPWRGRLGNSKINSKLSLTELNQNLASTINHIEACKVVGTGEKQIICETSSKTRIIIKLSDKFYKTAKFEEGDIILFRKTDNDYELYQVPEVTGGIIVMDAKTGEVLALSGGYSFDINPFNCITQATRQPGSTIKPFVYATAIEEGMSDYDIVEDKQISIKLRNGKIYTPHNYDGKTYGETYLRDGLIYSRNLTTVNIAQNIGMTKISKLLQEFGLIRGKAPISAVLGSMEVTPLQIVTAFSAFFNDGKMVYPRFVKTFSQQTQAFHLETLRDILCKNKTKIVLSKRTANIIKNILHDVVQYGTANKISNLENLFNVKLYGKTGTTNNFKDAWFVGGIEKDEKTYLVCVFIGYPKPKSLGEHCSGSKVALPVFANFIKNLLTSK